MSTKVNFQLIKLTGPRPKPISDAITLLYVYYRRNALPYEKVDSIEPNFHKLIIYDGNLNLYYTFA